MPRNKTELRHINRKGEKIRVTEENGELFIGNTNERAEGKVVHYKSIQHMKKGSTRLPHQINNPYFGSGHGEWDDYAHTSADL